MTKEDLYRQRKVRKSNGNLYTKRYEKTPNGFLMRLYRNMTSRVNGVQKPKHHLYKGKYLLPKLTFYSWAHWHPVFWALWADWVESDYDRKLTPSVDRINSKLGYRPSNMEWVTHSENSRRGGRNKKV